ncbi:AraC family transcriptional regulator [Xanthobacter sp.]|uniref:AraC family transcriptional regulator n=1 Tax=Xanthobacter sp. TaxID=35809 RepID=UPI0025ECD66A|nr:AraC family transcriptional regulator [Xanthobacter sp.]
MWDRHPIRLSLVHMLPKVADVRGVPLAPLFGRAGLADATPRDCALDDPSLGGDRVVARGQISTLLFHLARRSGEAAIGLDLADAADPMRLGLAGRALFAGRTLRDCFSALHHQMPDLQGGVSVAIEERDGVALWRHRLADSDPEHAQVLNEGIGAFTLRALRAITGADAAPVHLRFAHRAKAPATLYEDRLNAGVSFGTGDGIEIRFDARWLDQPNLLFVPSREGTAADLPPAPVSLGDDALMAMIEALFDSTALTGTLSLVDTARSLGLSPRTLQRRLARLGTSYEVQLDIWRHAQARLHLGGSTTPVASVSRALGYGHPAHFVRAFRRWEGRTPLAFRTAARIER